jgi:transcriptional regulator with XRE-family HTH domain
MSRSIATTFDLSNRKELKMQATTGATVDVGALYAALDQKRKQQTLTWRGIARMTGTSPSTFTRMAQGHRPDVDTFMTLCSWLGVPAEEFMRGRHAEESQDNTLALITAHLRASRELSPRGAKAMEDIIQAAYEQLKTGD